MAFRKIGKRLLMQGFGFFLKPLQRVAEVFDAGSRLKQQATDIVRRGQNARATFNQCRVIQRDIGILRAMGMPRRAVLRVFLIQGGVLGLLGALAGSVAGAGLARLFAGLVRNTQGDPLFPIALTPELFLSAVAVAVFTGLLAASLPASRAAALDPVKAIRNS